MNFVSIRMVISLKPLPHNPPAACLYFSLFSFLHSDSIFPFKEDPHFHRGSEVVLTGDPFIAGR